MVAVLVGWVYESTTSLAQVAALMVIRLVPPIVGGGLAASVVDRLPRLRVLIWSEVACAATIAGALAGVMTGSRALVFTLVGVCSLVATVSNVAGTALIPLTVERDELAAANGIHSIGQETAMAIGAVTGGVMLAVGGPAAGLALNLVSYGVAVLLYARVRVQEPARMERRSGRGGLREGLRYIAGQRALAIVVGGFSVVTLAAGLINATLPKFTSGLGLGAGGYGIALSALATGMIAGEALTGAVAKRIEPRWLGAALTAMGCLCLAFAWSGNGYAALLSFAAFGVANGFAEVLMMTAIHQHADQAYQGRVFGLGSTIWRTTMLGAVALAPVVDAIASPAQAVTLAATLLLAGGVFVHVRLKPLQPPVPAAA
jgi:MFS family permease